MMPSAKNKPCPCPNSCICWDSDDRPGLVLGCQCTGLHVRPYGCRYRDDVDGWATRWPGVDGAVMVCLTHGGRAPGTAYEDPSTTEPCLDSHLHRAKPRAGSAGRRQDRDGDLVEWVAARWARERPTERPHEWLAALAAAIRLGVVVVPSRLAGER